MGMIAVLNYADMFPTDVKAKLRRQLRRTACQKIRTPTL